MLNPKAKYNHFIPKTVNSLNIQSFKGSDSRQKKQMGQENTKTMHNQKQNKRIDQYQQENLECPCYSKREENVFNQNQFQEIDHRDRLQKCQLNQKYILSQCHVGKFSNGELLNLVVVGLQNKQVGCDCCGDFIALSRGLPKTIATMLIEPIHDNTFKNKQKHIRQVAKLCVCILNQGGGVFMAGGKQNKQNNKFSNSDNKEGENQDQIFTKMSRDFRNEATLLSKADVEKNIDALNVFFMKVSALIYIHRGSKNQFKIMISPIKFQKYSKGPQPTQVKKCWAIRIKIIPLYTDRPYYFYQELPRNKKQCFVLVRNTKGELSEIKGQNLYQYFSKLKQFDKKIKQSQTNFIANHINFEVVEARIRFSSSFAVCHESNITPTFTYDLSMVICVASSKVLSRLQESIKYLQKSGYDYNLCQPYSKLRYNTTERIMFLNIDMRRNKFQCEKTNMNFPIQHAYFVTKILSVDQKQIKNFQRFLKQSKKIIQQQFGQTQKCSQLIRNDNLLIFDNLQAAILVFVYLKSQGLEVSFLEEIKN